MKRFIAILLTVSILLCSLSGCGIGGFYTVTVTGSRDSLMTSLMPVYRAGTVVKINAYSVTDVTLDVYVNGKQIPMTHFDSDYWGYEFVMPEENVTVHLTYDPFYGKNNYTFNELHGRLDLLDDSINMVSLRIENHTEGVYDLTETRYSYKQEDIEKFKAIVDQELTKRTKNNGQLATYAYSYCFYNTEESDISIIEPLRFYDEFFHWNNFSQSRTFQFVDETYALPTIDEPDYVTYSFIYDGRSSDVKRYDDENFSVRFFLNNNFEFVKYEGEIPEGDYVFYLDSRYGKINLIDSTIFELNGEYYEVISYTNYWAYNLIVAD